MSNPKSTVITASGDITRKVEMFQAALGDPLNNDEPYQQPAGRREINWDGVPTNLTDTPHFPGDFFNSFELADPPARKRGAAFFTDEGGTFEVSGDDFAHVDPSYSQEFHAFSKRKTFTVSDGNTLEVRFQAVGAPTPALVKGFGVVFSDVDKEGSARIELFGNDGLELGTLTAPRRADKQGLSFVGVVFDTPIITSARITSGEAALGPGVKDVSSGGTKDLVVMDDFIYGETRAME
ncbi:hypothetical protein [Archangium lipolyticum]|uniref:hypothetical protein n=1 Tax=Archangium lipolyticum TaxID=2970465 RepID=UPI002149BC81|nr:hypothetical protein [Archangium lipolyticum]